MPEVYGQLQSEKMAEDAAVGRQIALEISHFGITDRQRWHVIYQLALELEDVEDMKEITSLIRERKGADLFVSQAFCSEDA